MLNLVIVILTFSMIALMILYTLGNIDSADNGESFDKLWIVQDYEETAFSVFNNALTIPTIIAYKQPSEATRAVISDEELASTLYSILSDVILDVFGNKSVCRVQDDTEASASELLNADSYLLFEYGADIPYPYIYALSSNMTSVNASMCAVGEFAYVSKIAFILNTKEDGSVEYSCLAFDSNCNTYRFEHSDASPYLLENSDIIHLDAYASNFEEVRLVSTGNVGSGFEVLYGSVGYYPLKASAGMDFLQLESSGVISSFLELFEMNPEKVNNYVERDGTTIFIGSDERLKVSTDGNVIYESSGEPILLKNILGYTPSQKSSYSIFDMLKASDIMIENFRAAYPEYVGKSAQIKLSGVYKNADKEPVLEYSYFYNGTLIDTKCAFRFTFDSNGITELCINFTGFTVMADKRVTLPKKNVYERICERLAAPADIRPIYTASEDGDGLYLIDWALY